MEKEAAAKRKRQILRYGISAALLLAIAAAIAAWKNLFAAENAEAVFRILSDSFTVPGVVFAGIGGLSFVASKGGYDAFGYTFYNFALHNLFPTRHPKKYASLYDYKQEKNEKGRRWWPHLLWTGLGGLAVSLLFLILYFTNAQA